MIKFSRIVDKRSKKEMISYLWKHFRYSTMNNWNNSTSYACNMKIYNLGLDKEIADKLYDLISIDGFYEPLNDLMDSFAADHSYKWQVGMNGRSGGYLVLYQGGWKPSEHKSYCTSCGQQNYRSITETGNVCGRCHEASRVDYASPPLDVFTSPGKSTDMNVRFSEWTMDDLRDRVNLVQDFDRLADALVAEAVYIAENYAIEEESYLVEKTRQILVHSA